jgi:hypothetical protein
VNRIQYSGLNLNMLLVVEETIHVVAFIDNFVRHNFSYIASDAEPDINTYRYCRRSDSVLVIASDDFG